MSAVFIMQACCDFGVSVSQTLKSWLNLKWKEDYNNADTMSMNVDVGWCTSLDGDWELFGGEMKLDGLSCSSDVASVHADSMDDVGWTAVEDDASSVCSSATSWTCLHGNSHLETCNTSYYCLT